jgi:zinc transport system permease protein
MLSPEVKAYRGISHHTLFDFSQLNPGTRIRVRHDGDVATVIFEDYGWHEYIGQWLDEGIDRFNAWAGSGLLSSRSGVMALLGAIMVSLICGPISSLVVTNRMSFFSDALAHCAFAGVALGFILQLAGAAFGDSGILGTMVVFGVLVGVAIAFVREQTALANDTVIGVFFAGAMGLGAVLLTGIGSTGSRFSPERFVFGDPQGVNGQDLFYLLLLLAAVLALFVFLFNRLVFASFNPSLARSRNFPVRLGNYLFIALLGLTVNLCLKISGALLISALLVVPGATATNLAKNLRQFFWASVGLSLFSGVAGWLISLKWIIVYEGREISFGSGGVTVVAGVIIFFVSMALSPWIRGARTAARVSF